MTVRCNACGEEWPRDPALEVDCPDCRAGLGSACRRPSGHSCAVHASRDRLAMGRGFFAPCLVAETPLPELPSDDLPLFAFDSEFARTT
jgi:hypothetical protein